MDSNGRISSEQVFVSDFGVMHWWPKYNPRTGEVQKIPGTPPYVAPEVLRNGRASLSIFSDVWSVGCLGFEFSTGRKLFESEAVVEEYAETGNIDPAKIALLQRQPDLMRVIEGCLQREPEERWSAWALVDQIERMRQED